MASILEAAIGDAFGLYGEKPKVPKFKKIDTTKEQAGAIAGNLSNFTAASELAGNTNAFNQDQFLAMMRKAIPDFDKISASISGNIASQARGEIPQDVADAIKRNSATKSLYGGYGGSGMADGLQARDLGLTSLQLTDNALNSATQWMQASKVGQMDVSSMFINPMEKTQVDMQQNSEKWNRNWLNAQVKAAASPTEQAYMAGISSDLGVMSSMAGGAAGGGGGGGGGSL